jgi:hypothetical protein
MSSPSADSLAGDVQSEAAARAYQLLPITVIESTAVPPAEHQRSVHTGIGRDSGGPAARGVQRRSSDAGPSAGPYAAVIGLSAGTRIWLVTGC